MVKKAFTYPVVQQPDSTGTRSGQPDTLNKSLTPVTSGNPKGDTTPEAGHLPDSLHVKVRTDSSGPARDTIAKKSPDTTTANKVTENDGNGDQGTKSIINEILLVEYQGDPDTNTYVLAERKDEFCLSKFQIRLPVPADTDTVYLFFDEDLAAIKTDQADSLKIKSIQPDTGSVPQQRIAVRSFPETPDCDDVNNPGITRADWMIGILLFSLILLAWLRIFYNKYMDNVVRSAVSYQSAYKMFESRSPVTQRISFVLNLFFVVNLGLLIYQLLDYYGLTYFSLYGIRAFLAILGFTIALYIGKYLILKIIGFVFDAAVPVSEYLHHIFIYNKNLGLILFPVVICIPYVPENMTGIFVIVGIVLFGLFFLFRIFRGIRLSIKISLSIFYLILYLCILEMLPMLIFYKIFKLLS
ncbi:MAG: DUF4271 domain-containing protein [Bacteroidetes bacterium]|nr:DUF4271 domain-containing protein [Bacteroidota bacterium]